MFGGVDEGNVPPAQGCVQEGRGVIFFNWDWFKIKGSENELKKFCSGDGFIRAKFIGKGDKGNEIIVQSCLEKGGAPGAQATHICKRKLGEIIHIWNLEIEEAHQKDNGFRSGDGFVRAKFVGGKIFFGEEVEFLEGFD